MSEDYQRDDSNEGSYDDTYERNENNVEFDVVDIENEKANDGNEKRKHSKRWIKFHIIVNTNKSQFTLEQHQFEELRTKLSNSCKTFLKENLPHLYDVEEVHDPGTLEGVPLNDRVLKKKAEFVVEVGPVRGLVHCHMVISFYYRAVRIVFDKIGAKKAFEKLMGRGLYFYCKTYRSARENLQDYIRKTQYAEY